MTENNCYNCRYRGRTNLQGPCSTGTYQLAYSGKCFEWRKRYLPQRIADKIKRKERRTPHP